MQEMPTPPSPAAADVTVAVLGLGYVGLPLAEALAAAGRQVIGYDIAARRLEALAAAGLPAGLAVTADPRGLGAASAFVIAVPTPITEARRPDLSALAAASDAVGEVIGRGGLVVVESTVAPGTTRDLVAARIAAKSGLVPDVDFHVAYSPERINPGDAAHALDKVPKVVSGATPAALARLEALYGPIVPAGLVRAPSIEAAELAKLVENTQRDLNIALMNELALICDRLSLRTADVLAVARTKWNFLPFEPGLVGGHCISVDPWYLTDKAEALGLHPDVVAAGRRTNDSMASFVAQKTLKLLSESGLGRPRPRVGVLGVTFKEDFPDIRNSQVLVLCRELIDFGVELVAVDPVADPEEVHRSAGVRLSPMEAAQDLDALVLAVRHSAFLGEGEALAARLASRGVLIDVKSALDPARVPTGIRYWSL
jgi:UDP-N-acetyl-D-galactosamine dehydrogenase